MESTTTKTNENITNDIAANSSEGAPANPVNLTSNAIKQVHTLKEQMDKKGWGLRLAVKGGGCSGLSYVVDLVEKSNAHDTVFTVDDVTVFIDPKSKLYLSGMVVDYVTSITTSGFVFKNPNATSTCGCGTSFSV